MYSYLVLLTTKKAKSSLRQKMSELGKEGLANGWLTCIGKELYLTRFWFLNIFFLFNNTNTYKTTLPLHQSDSQWKAFSNNMHFHLPLEILKTASCLLADNKQLVINVCVPQRNSEGFLNQLTLNRFIFYVSLITSWRKILRETKLKVGDIKNYFSWEFSRNKAIMDGIKGEQTTEMFMT